MDIARSMYENMTLTEAINHGYVPDIASYDKAHKLANDLNESGQKLPQNKWKTIRSTMIPVRDKQAVATAGGTWKSSVTYLTTVSQKPINGNLGQNMTLVPEDEIDFYYDFGYILCVDSATAADEKASYLDDVANFIELSGANIVITEKTSRVELLNQPLRTLHHIVQYSGFMAVTGAGPTSTPASLVHIVKPNPEQIGGLSPMLLVGGRTLSCVITFDDSSTIITNAIDIEIVLAAKQYKVIA